jgi:hypothetical protein
MDVKAQGDGVLSAVSLEDLNAIDFEIVVKI